MRPLRTEQRGQQGSLQDSEKPLAYTMDARLLAGCSNATERDEVAILFRQSRRIRELVAGVLTAEIARGTIGDESGSWLTSPNALAEMADRLAYRRGLRAALKLLNPDQGNP